MPLLGSLVWGAPQWLWPAVAIAIVLAMIVAWSYGRGQLSSSAQLAAFALKVIAIALLALCLLDPLQTGTRPRPQANLFPLLVDHSQSMSMRSEADGKTRSERVTELLADESPWRVRLAQDFDVRAYQFASRLEPMAEPVSIDAVGTSSSLASSLTAIKERLRGRPIAGVLVFTDGNLTDDSQAPTDWSSLGFPVYPVIAMREDAPGDLRITDASVSQTDFETSPVSIKVSVASQAMPDQSVIVKLEELGSQKTVLEQSIQTLASGEPQTTTLKFKPSQPGVGFYRVVVFRESDRSAVEAGEETTEATFANNTRWLAIDRGKGPHRILYLSGRPNWDFKFIRRAVSVDPEVKLVGLLRIANKESKFTFRDREVTSTNPLFAGLGEDAEEAAEQYDEPVMIRLGVEVEDELSAGFPKLAEELFGYEAVILDDIEADFFSPDQLLMLRRFVTFRGGGLLMMGGQEAFDAKRFATSPLGELSPVYAPRSDNEASSEPFRLELTREGLLQPWIRLRETESSETERLQNMPRFNTVNPVGAPKPGAIQVATLRDLQGNDVPALVFQRFGKGKSAALTLGDTWKWSMRRKPGDEDDPARMWRQIMRWLVSDVPQRAQCKIEQSDAADGQVTIRTEVRDEAYMPLDNAKVEIDVTPIGVDDEEQAKTITLVAQSDDQVAGTYRTNFFASKPGGYLATARVTAEDGSELETTQSGWASQPGEAEFRQWAINRDYLEKLAKQTGGTVVDDRKLDRFVADLNNRKVPVEEVWTYPLWHQPWVMLFAILCLCGEWGLRRWKGLP